jgi:DNA processing protein
MPIATLHADRAQCPDADNALARSAAGLLALQALPRVGAKTALRAALASVEFEALISQHVAAWPAALARAYDTLEDCDRRDIRVLSLFDERYPQRLRAIHDPPPLLFVRGSSDALLNERMAAVVGTREPTSFGCSATEQLTSALASGGWGVVSGLAKGIDTVAHDVALRYGVLTVAVMAGGLDRIYPQENAMLAAAIVDSGGALIAEVPPGVRPQRSSFVARNRLQTGLAVAVVVAQTGVDGGTMHTVRHAATQGRPVFCAKPLSKHEKNAGLSVLLTSPARELCNELPAWGGSQRLCGRLGPQPLAKAIGRDELDDLLDWFEFALKAPQTTPETRWWPTPDADSAAGCYAPANYDEQSSLFALSD